jgi:thioredoxin-related protein
MKYIIFLFSFIPLLTHAQDKKGVQFEQNINWQQLQQKAQSDNKYIFLDFYATWCGPCKEMDNNVYLLDSVGSYFENKFLSLKIQIDTSKNDGTQIKKWYSQAHLMQEKYKITTLPTFLFFSPNGILVHRGTGYKTPDEFLQLANNAQDSSTQYYTLVNKYQQGKKNYLKMRSMALSAKIFGDKEISNAIAIDYTHNYLNRLNDSLFLTKENLEFISQFPVLLTSNEKIFHYYYKHSDQIDKIMNNFGYADHYIRAIITKEEIYDKLFHNGNTTTPISKKPDWEKIRSDIRSKYGAKYAAATIPDAQLLFYKITKNWSLYTKIKDEEIKKNGIEISTNVTSKSTSGLNMDAWYLFQHSNDKKVLRKALDWTDLIIKMEEPNPNIQFLDTRANLLYKLGNVDAAIQQEQAAIDIDSKNALKEGKSKGDLYEEFTDTINKMRKKQPTW